MKNKFIAPGGWFSIEYPQTWNEFEDEEGSFLFYNPNRWTGNFRISAFKDASRHFAKQIMEEELRGNKTAQLRKIGEWDCVCSSETIVDNGENYCSYLYITGKDTLSIECSFTAKAGESVQEVEEIIQSLDLRMGRKSLQKELIPIRVWEIHQVDEAFDWTSKAVKKILKKDFTGVAADIPHLQTLIDGDLYKPGQRDTWEAIGIAFGTILTNEMDGMEWKTVIEGTHEYPVLQFKGTDVIVEPMMLITEKKRKEVACDLQEEFDRIKNEIEKQL